MTFGPIFPGGPKGHFSDFIIHFWGGGFGEYSALPFALGLGRYMRSLEDPPYLIREETLANRVCRLTFSELPSTYVP